ncbi:hypothetical protein POV27_19555 [Aureisphaera galaxeae]|uniref:hypothetical protein n=1 Tax=Aureisphaera galaxeae TaxID=1538023 RepID=UPI002350DFB5|nr:hypothetical protein [Aureisphaera galaxeae]MDC8006259.1 hypothetical protein [Aureisphaera galaxeae]
MKKLTYIFLFLCMSISYAQTDADYEKIVAEVTAGYNNKDAAAIHQLFSSDLQASYSIDKLKEFVETTQLAKGALNESSLLMTDESGAQFLAHFEKADALLVLILSPDGKLTKFEIAEY